MDNRRTASNQLVRATITEELVKKGDTIGVVPVVPKRLGRSAQDALMDDLTGTPGRFVNLITNKAVRVPHNSILAGANGTLFVVARIRFLHRKGRCEEYRLFDAEGGIADPTHLEGKLPIGQFFTVIEVGE